MSSKMSLTSATDFASTAGDATVLVVRSLVATMTEENIAAATKQKNIGRNS